jgi:hypothetical protein
MATGPLDELRTRLTPDGDFKEEAQKAKEEANALDKLEKEAKKLDDAMDKHAAHLRVARVGSNTMRTLLFR